MIQTAVNRIAKLEAEVARLIHEDQIKTEADEACAQAAEAEITRLTIRVTQLAHGFDAITDRAIDAEARAERLTAALRAIRALPGVPADERALIDAALDAARAE